MLNKKVFTTLFLLIAVFALLISCANPMGINNSGSSFSGSEFPTGALVEDEALKSQIGLYRSFTRGTTLPSKVDLTDLMPPAKSQGSQGSCVGWATAYAMKTFQEGIEESWDITVTSGQFSPSWVYNQINGGSDRGAYVTDALNLIVNHGCDTWENFPYNSSNYTNQPDDDSFARAFNFKAKSWKYIPNDVDELKNIIATEGQSIIFRLSVYPDFDSISPTNPVYDDASGSSRGGHALCIVGYDDDLQAFKFQNSWGSNWGTYRDDDDTTKGKGFGWVSYDFVVDGNPIGFQSYKLVDDENYTAETLWSENDLYENRSATIYYYGELMSSTAITLNWTSDVATESGSAGMYKSGGLWRSSFTVPDGITEISFSIEDNEGTIDDNDGAYWTFVVSPTFQAQFNCLSGQTSNPVPNVSFYLRNTDTNEYYSAYSSSTGPAVAQGLTSGAYTVSAYSNNYTFENGTTSYEFTFDLDSTDYEQDIILDFARGSMSLTFTGFTNTGSDNPMSGMPLDLYLDDVYEKTVNIYGYYNGSAYASDYNMQPGVWKAVLDGFKAGHSYKAEVEFTLDETSPTFTDTVTVSVKEDPTRKMVYYYNSTYEAANIHFQKDDGSWTESPGLEMRVNYDGWYSLLIEDSDELVFCFNNGDGMWDSKNGSNYSTSLQEIYVRNGKIYTQKFSDNTLTLKVQKDSIPSGYSLQVHTNQEIYDNEPWGYGYSMYLAYNSDYYIANLYFENGTSLEYKYTLVDQTGFIYWESLEGNRSAITPDFKTDEPVFEIDNKLVTFNITGLNIDYDYSVEVRGDFGDEPWSAHTMYRQYAGNFSLTMRIDEDNFDYKYTILDPNGHIIWENIEENHAGTSPGTFNDTPSFTINENDVIFTVTGNNIPEDSILEVRGSFSNWSAVLLDFSGNDTWTKTISINEADFEYKYTCKKTDGTIIWENWTGNRNGSSPGSYTDTAYFQQ